MATYTALTTRIKASAAINPSDSDFDAHWPAILLDAETRIYRDLDPLVARKYATTTFGASAPANAVLAQPADCIVIRGLHYFTPAGSQTNRFTIEERDEEFVKDYWPARGLTGLPKYFCKLGHNQVLVAPSPNGTYTVEMPYTYRPPTLSSASPGDGTQTTVLSTVYEDLLFAAAMVGVAGYKKNYGASADDPREGVTWEIQYQARLAAARDEEMSRKAGSRADESPSQASERNPVD